ncbi:hypothetical protein EJ04DRAFT_510785 [Polyplosphaeria fusca]|uniref:F-box domain-containing protein n=1 Tax=Polyplosphaeria fusca TaxID=682080 RepID=A0A9P4R5K7_9PLEO|nr:hypothetical protein EJ04DRAFT_510785 [Polyplosphaeria fusca]
MKRPHDADACNERPPKIPRTVAFDRLSGLSDELLVKVLSFASVETLLDCQRVSKKFGRLSVDSELWKAAYYERFVRPRASRIPIVKGDRTRNHPHLEKSRLSKWLDEQELVEKGSRTNWKQQFRLRHNWSLGRCAVSEIVVADQPSEPPLLVMMHDSIIFMADSILGLRAWDMKVERELIASTPLGIPEAPRLPTSMAVGSQDTCNGSQKIALGFDDGGFTIFSLDLEAKTFNALFSHPPSTNGMLLALAYSSPYLLTMTEDQLLSLYTFEGKTPRLLYSLRSHTIWPPASLSIRMNASGVTAAIAYALPTYLSGWTVGVQEILLTHEGTFVESRLATAIDQSFGSLAGHPSMSSPSTRASSPFPGTSREPSFADSPSRAKPTSLSYSHPYLLATHPDNTLTLYLVRSTSESLSVGAGSRLWGHTSSVSGAHVGTRGKAVSVSRLGNELRVWDLEGGLSSKVKRRPMNGEFSVRVQPATAATEALEDLPNTSPHRFSLRRALDQGFDDTTVSQGWVGFDDENVFVLRENSKGSQALAVYDFT